MRAAPAVVLLLIVLAGCTGTFLPASQTTTVSPVADECRISSLSFAGEGGAGWERDTIRLNYTLTGPADVFLVVREYGDVIGVGHVQSDGAKDVTHAPLRLNRSLTGIHTIRVMAYGDRDGNGQFDVLTDLTCEVDDAPLATRAIVRNFSRFAE